MSADLIKFHGIWLLRELPSSIIGIRSLRELILINNPNLHLTADLHDWLSHLRNNGTYIYL